ncbi:MAG: hypothetical protein R3D56_17615 [Paracoccaceae bacterium]
MQETFFIATLFALLAFAGVEAGHAQPMKVCRVGVLSQVLGGC